MMLRYCANLKAVSYESTSLNRIVANKSHRVIVAEGSKCFKFLNVKKLQVAIYFDLGLAGLQSRYKFTMGFI